MWGLKTTTVQVVMGVLGTIKKDMENYSNKIPGNINIYELQKITLLSSAHLLWRVLSIKQKPVCLPKSMVWTRSWERKSTTITAAYISFKQLFRERLSDKVHATTAKCIVGGLEFTVFQRNLKEWQERSWTYVCECWMNLTKVGSTATVSGTVYWSYPTLPFGIFPCTFFPTTFLEIAVYNNNDFISSISTKVALSGNDKRK